MSGFLKVAALVATVAFSACAQAPTSGASQPPPAPSPAPAPGMVDTKAHCEASKAASAIGRAPSTKVTEDARLEAGAEIVRTLRHDQIITKEYRVGRLNLVLDASGRIASVNCS